MTTRATIAFRVEAPVEERERLLAELVAWGSLGLEENDAGFVAYFPESFGEAPDREGILALRDPERNVSVLGPNEVPHEDWEASWRRGLVPRQVGPLWVRPSWCDSQGLPELVIDPQQAFGSGEHATTRIALELMTRALRPGDRVLDVGSGSGILGLGALRLGARSATGCDLERAACLNAGENARRNELPLALFCGTLAALRAARAYDLVLANLLWSELSPWIERVVRHAQRELVVSGALVRERSAILERLGGLGCQRIEEQTESQSGDDWWGARFSAPRERRGGG